MDFHHYWILRERLTTSAALIHGLRHGTRCSKATFPDQVILKLSLLEGLIVAYSL
jgi:hypothetical protein